MSARLKQSAAPWVGVWTKYNPQFIAALKNVIPIRAWDNTYKTWWFPPEYTEDVRALLVRFFGTDPMLEETDYCHSGACYAPPPPPPRREDPNDPYTILCVSRSAPNAVIKAAYKALALELHPDRRGGSSEPMVKVNNAFDAIRAERGL